MVEFLEHSPFCNGEKKKPQHGMGHNNYQVPASGDGVSDLRLGCVNPAALLPVAFVARETIATFVMHRVTVLH